MVFQFNKPWSKYFLPFAAVTLFFLLIATILPESSFASDFLLKAWYIQALNTWLFLVGLIYWWQRQVLLKGEKALQKEVIIPNEPIYRDRAEKLIETAPVEYREALTVRRFRELLQGALYGEDIILLNGELSRRDITEIERGHLVLDSLKNIIPVVGFLGTVLGLSLGMIQFPEVSNIDALRNALKGFAASLSVAFNTTLLALSYTIVLILLTSFLKEREEALVSGLDRDARLLISGLKLDKSGHGESSDQSHDLAVAVSEQTATIANLLQEINESLQRLHK